MPERVRLLELLPEVDWVSEVKAILGFWRDLGACFGWKGFAFGGCLVFRLLCD